MTKKIHAFLTVVFLILFCVSCQKPSAIKITSNPPGLKVILLDNTQAVTPLDIGNYAEGTYRVTVVLDQELKMPIEFEVVKGKTAVVHAEFYKNDTAKDLLIAARAVDKTKLESLSKTIGSQVSFHKSVYQAAQILSEKNEVTQAASLLAATGPHSYDQEGFLSFFRYCFEENAAELLGFLFPIYSGPDEIVSGGSTLLTRAVSLNQKEIAEYLLQNKANPDLSDNNGSAPLTAACRAGNRGIASLLLKYKASTKLSAGESGYGIYLCALFNRELDGMLKNPPMADFSKIDIRWSQVEAALGRSMYDRDIYRKYHFLKAEQKYLLGDYPNAAQSYLKASQWVPGNNSNLNYPGYFINLDIITWPKATADETAPFAEIAYKAMISQYKSGNTPWALLWLRVALRLQPAVQLRIYSDPLATELLAAHEQEVKDIINEEILPE